MADRQTRTGETIVIQPSKGWHFVNWRELIQHRDLLYFMVLRDIKGKYKQTVIGFGWAVIQPVFTMIVFSIVFGRLAKISSDGIPYPLFSYAALVPWTYFSNAFIGSTSSLIGGANIFSKVYFPRLIIPMVPVMSGFVDFGISFLIIFVLMIYYGVAVTLNILLLPLLVLLLMFTATGIGLWLSTLALQYRDVKYAVTFLSQLLLYAAPVAWPVSLIPEKYRLIYGLYPMAGIIEGFRSVLLSHNPIPWDLMGVGAASTTVIFLSGALFFRRKERYFADVA